MSVVRSAVAASAVTGSLRTMSMFDVDSVCAVEARCYSHPWSRGNFVDSLTSGYLAQVLESPQGEMLGYFVAMQGVDEMHLLNIAVSPDFQSAGLGRQMLKALELQALERQLHMVWLEVRRSNMRAQSLYKRLGFVEVGLRKGYYPAVLRREDAVVMRLSLGQEPQT